MQTRARRRLDMALLAGGVLLAGVGGLGGAVAGAAVANPEEIDAIWTSATVREDGSAEVVEVIDYDFGFNSRHGIFRDIPGLPPTTPVAVESDDAPDEFVVETAPNGDTRLRIGDPDTTISGEHRYRITYDLPGVVQGGTLDWETFGYRWEVDTDQAEAHVLAPFELESPICVEGPPGSTTPCDLETVAPGHIVARVDEVPAGEGMSVEATQGAPLGATPASPEPPAQAPEEESNGTGVLPPAMAAAGGAALAAFPASRLVRRAGREEVSSGGAADAAYGGTPPAGYGPWTTAAGPYQSVAAAAAPAAAGPGAPPPPQRPLPPPPGSSGGPAAPDDRPPPPRSAFASVLPGRSAHHPVAPPPSVGRIGEPIAGPPTWLPAEPVRIDEAELAEMATIEFAPPAELTPAQGGIVLEEAVRPNHKAAWLVQAAIDGDVDIESSGDKATGLVRTGPGNAETVVFLDRAFRGRTQVSLLKYDRDFSAAWSGLGAQLSQWRANSGLWDRKGDSRRITWRVMAGIAFVVGVVAVIGGALVANVVGSVALPIVLLGGLVGGAALAVLVRAWELRVRTAAGSGLWLRVESFRRFLAGSEAYHAEEAAKRGVLREYTAWALALGEIDRWRMAVLTSPNIPPDTPGLGYVWLGSSIIASTSTASTAPSSSGSGGSFGGGSVGGGAGGGGGGSW
jgi:hypothetical protein